jgi:hypothetical protein
MKDERGNIWETEIGFETKNPEAYFKVEAIKPSLFNRIRGALSEIFEFLIVVLCFALAIFFLRLAF